MNRSGLLKFAGSAYSPIGLDIGESSISMAQLQRTKEGWAIRDMILKEIPVSQTEMGGNRKDAIIQTIRESMQKYSFSGRSVVSVMPSYQLDIIPFRLSLSAEETLEDAVLREARAHLSYDLDNAVVDYISDDNGDVKGRAARALLIAARREDVDEHLTILKGAKLRPVAVDISACALGRLIRYSMNDRDNNALVINAGELNTTLTVLWKETIFLDRNIPWGRENMVEGLMSRLKLDRQKAGRLLDRAGMHSGHREDTGQDNKSNVRANNISETVYEILAPQFERLASEVDKVLQYFSSEMRGAAIDVLYLLGAAGHVSDLDSYLEKRTGISASKFNPLSILDMAGREVPKSSNGGRTLSAVALGLALRGHENLNVESEGK